MYPLHTFLDNVLYHSSVVSFQFSSRRILPVALGMDADASTSAGSFSEYQAKLQNAVLQPTKLALGLPKDLAFHRTLDRDFAEEVDACSTRALSLANKLIKLASSGDFDPLEGEDDVVDHFHTLVVDVMDRLLEQAVRAQSPARTPAHALRRTRASTSTSAATGLPRATSR